MDMLRDPAFVTWYHIGTQHADLVPQYVSDASPLTEKTAESIEGSLFADPVDRAYPLDSAANVWLSSAYFAKHADETYVGRPHTRDRVEADIKRAAKVYGISKDVDAIMSAIRDESIVKTAADEDDPDNWGWPERKKYPLFQREDIKTASDYFFANKRMYPSQTRRKVASQIIKRAKDFGVTPPDALLKYAGIGFPRTDVLAAEILYRMKETSRIPGAEALVTELGTCIEKVAMDTRALTPDTLTGIVDVLDSVDRMYDTDGYRAKRGEFVDPEEAAFGITPSEADDFARDSVQLGKHVFSVRKLAEVDMSVFERVLGSEFTDSVKTAGVINPVRLGDALSKLQPRDNNALYSALVNEGTK